MARSRTSAARSASPARSATTSAAGEEKVVAIAQAKKGGRTLVHGSFLMERPPDEYTLAVEALVGENWAAEGLAGAGIVLAPETIWNTTLPHLEAALRRAASRVRRSGSTKVLVLGGGPAGYVVAAGRAAQLGADVTVVEAREIGGTCLNRGCIPTKAMVAGAERVHEARRAAEYGVQVGAVGLDFAAFMARKDATARQLRDGVAHLLKARKVQVVAGRASSPAPAAWPLAPGATLPDGTVLEEGGELQGDAVILASGSRPSPHGPLRLERLARHDQRRGAAVHRRGTGQPGHRRRRRDRL